MTEPLSDDTLAEYAELLANADLYPHPRYPGDLADAIRDLLAEVARLKARENDLISDLEMFGVAMRELVLGRIGGDAPGADKVAEVIRQAVEKTKVEWESIESENATLREDNARLVAALEAQGQAAFVAGMRAEAVADQNDGGGKEEDEEGAYCIDFDFDAEGDPPKVLIYDAEDGLAMMEIFEEPTCRHPSGWSWEPEDWEPGPLAKEVLDMLNGEPEEEDDDE